MRYISCAILIAAVCGCSNDTEVTPPVGALAQLAPEPRYEVVKLPASLGGTVSVGIGINNLGWVAGFSNLPGNGTRHAALWRDGAILDLGTLGGPNSNVQWPGLNNGGMIVGIIEMATLDPLGEEWSCHAGAAPTPR